MTCKSLCRVVACFTGVLCTTSSAFATGSLFAVSEGGRFGLRTLYALDPSTGHATEVGPLIIPNTASIADNIGLDFDAAGRLLGAGVNAAVYVIDTSTGMATELNGQHFTVPEGGMAVNQSTNKAIIVSGSVFWERNLATGGLVKLGIATFNGVVIPTATNIDGLAYRGDQLYGLVTIQAGNLGGHLIRIDLGTLAVTDIGFTGLSGSETAGLAYSPLGDFFYAAGYGDGTLYAVDPVTALASSIGNHNLGKITGLAYRVPEPSGIVLGLLATVGLFVWRACRTGRSVS